MFSVLKFLIIKLFKSIINELEPISDDIISKIGDKEYLKYEMNYLGFNIIINIYVLYDKKLLGDFQVENSDVNVKLTQTY